MKSITLRIKISTLTQLNAIWKDNALFFIMCFLGILSMATFMHYFLNGLGLAYNDARSHLDMGRRIVEGLKPGFAQLGGVWLPLPHLLMIPTVWNDFMWHSGLSGALQSMVSYIVTGLLIYRFLEMVKVGMLGRIIAVLIFALNSNILYLQSTAMTELLLLATMTSAIVELVRWHMGENIMHLVKAAFWIMLSTLIRYDGWFLLIYSICLIVLYTWKRYGYKTTEGTIIFFSTLAGFGIFLWFLWNLLIYGNPLYFAFGPFSAHSQQMVWESIGGLATKKNFSLSFSVYSLAVIYSSGALTVLLAIFGGILFWRDKTIPTSIRIASTVLLSPFIFNVIALFLGHSILLIPGYVGGSWFNIRYGVMMIPSIAILVGYLIHRSGAYRFVIISLLVFVTSFSVLNGDSVVIDDAVNGESSYNVNEISGWLRENATNTEGFILMSVASHDPILFSSGLPVKRFIHEGTGEYWKKATTRPDVWARWIVMRVDDNSDITNKLVKQSGQFHKYQLVDRFPYAEIYELKPEYLGTLITKPILSQK